MTYPKNVLHGRLTDLMRLDLIQRWATVEVERPQTVAEHVYRTMALVDDFLTHFAGELAPSYPPEFYTNALRYALAHDGAESRTGDVSRLFKQWLPETALDGAEWAVCPWLRGEPAPGCAAKAVVALCDRLEGYLYLWHWGRTADPDLEFYLKSIHEEVAKATVEAAEALGIEIGEVAKWVARVRKEVK